MGNDKQSLGGSRRTADGVLADLQRRHEERANQIATLRALLADATTRVGDADEAALWRLFSDLRWP